MRRTILVFLLVCFACSLAVAQEFSRSEAFGGFQYSNFDAFGIQRVNLLGWNGQYTYYFHKNVGITGDVSGVYGNPNVGGFTNNIKSYSYNFGPTLRMSESNTTPFIHALFGMTKTNVDDGALEGSWFSFALGGGFDAGISRNLAIRTFQADYMHTGYDYVLGTKSQSHFRLSTGVVFKF